jgi:hypothetical protein
VPPVKDIGERFILTPGDIEALVRDVLMRAGLSQAGATPLARSIRRAEIAGLRRLGLALVPHMVEHLRCDRVNGSAAARLTETAPAALSVDAEGGFSCPAVLAGLDALCDRAKTHGIAVLSVRNAYPVGSGLLFLDHCTAQGLIGFAQVAGLMARGAPNGSMVLEIEQRLLGLSQPSPLLPLPVIPGREGGPDTPFEGPLGPAFRLHHSFVAVRPELWHHAPDPPSPVQNSGIAVPSILLEKIINA